MIDAVGKSSSIQKFILHIKPFGLKVKLSFESSPRRHSGFKLVSQPAIRLRLCLRNMGLCTPDCLKIHSDGR